MNQRVGKCNHETKTIIFRRKFQQSFPNAEAEDFIPSKIVIIVSIFRDQRTPEKDALATFTADTLRGLPNSHSKPMLNYRWTIYFLLLTFTFIIIVIKKNGIKCGDIGAVANRGTRNMIWKNGMRLDIVNMTIG